MGIKPGGIDIGSHITDESLEKVANDVLKRVDSVLSDLERLDNAMGKSRKLEIGIDKKGFQNAEKIVYKELNQIFDKEYKIKTGLELEKLTPGYKKQLGSLMDKLSGKGISSEKLKSIRSTYTEILKTMHAIEAAEKNMKDLTGAFSPIETYDESAIKTQLKLTEKYLNSKKRLRDLNEQLAGTPAYLEEGFYTNFDRISKGGERIVKKYKEKAKDIAKMTTGLPQMIEEYVAAGKTEIPEDQIANILSSIGLDKSEQKRVKTDFKNTTDIINRYAVDMSKALRNVTTLMKKHDRGDIGETGVKDLIGYYTSYIAQGGSFKGYSSEWVQDVNDAVKGLMVDDETKGIEKALKDYYANIPKKDGIDGLIQKNKNDRINASNATKQNTDELSSNTSAQKKNAAAIEDNATATKKDADAKTEQADAIERSTKASQKATANAASNVQLRSLEKVNAELEQVESNYAKISKRMDDYNDRYFAWEEKRAKYEKQFSGKTTYDYQKIADAMMLQNYIVNALDFKNADKINKKAFSGVYDQFNQLLEVVFSEHGLGAYLSKYGTADEFMKDFDSYMIRDMMSGVDSAGEKVSYSPKTMKARLRKVFGYVKGLVESIDLSSVKQLNYISKERDPEFLALEAEKAANQTAYHENRAQKEALSAEYAAIVEHEANAVKEETKIIRDNTAAVDENKKKKKSTSTTSLDVKDNTGLSLADKKSVVKDLIDYETKLKRFDELEEKEQFEELDSKEEKEYFRLQDALINTGEAVENFRYNYKGLKLELKDGSVITATADSLEQLANIKVGNIKNIALEYTDLKIAVDNLDKAIENFDGSKLALAGLYASTGEWGPMLDELSSLTAKELQDIYGVKEDVANKLVDNVSHLNQHLFDDAGMTKDPAVIGVLNEVAQVAQICYKNVANYVIAGFEQMEKACIDSGYNVADYFETSFNSNAQKVLSLPVNLEAIPEVKEDVNKKYNVRSAPTFSSASFKQFASDAKDVLDVVEQQAVAQEQVANETEQQISLEQKLKDAVNATTKARLEGKKVSNVNEIKSMLDLLVQIGSKAQVEELRYLDDMYSPDEFLRVEQFDKLKPLQEKPWIGAQGFDLDENRQFLANIQKSYKDYKKVESAVKNNNGYLKGVQYTKYDLEDYESAIGSAITRYIYNMAEIAFGEEYFSDPDLLSADLEFLKKGMSKTFGNWVDSIVSNVQSVFSHNQQVEQQNERLKLVNSEIKEYYDKLVTNILSQGIGVNQRPSKIGSYVVEAKDDIRDILGWDLEYLSRWVSGDNNADFIKTDVLAGRIADALGISTKTAPTPTSALSDFESEVSSFLVTVSRLENYKFGDPQWVKDYTEAIRRGEVSLEDAINGYKEKLAAKMQEIADEEAKQKEAGKQIQIFTEYVNSFDDIDPTSLQGYANILEQLCSRAIDAEKAIELFNTEVKNAGKVSAPTPLPLIKESSGQLAFLENIKEASFAIKDGQNAAQAEIKETNDALEGQINLFDYLNNKNKDKSVKTPVRPGLPVYAGENIPDVIPLDFYKGIVRSIEDISDSLKGSGLSDEEINKKALEIRNAEILAIDKFKDGFIRLIHRSSIENLTGISKSGYDMTRRYGGKYSTLSSTFTALTEDINPNKDYGSHKGNGSFVVFDIPEDLYDYWERGRALPKTPILDDAKKEVYDLAEAQDKLTESTKNATSSLEEQQRTAGKKQASGTSGRPTKDIDTYTPISDEIQSLIDAKVGEIKSTVALDGLAKYAITTKDDEVIGARITYKDKDTKNMITDVYTLKKAQEDANEAMLDGEEQYEGLIKERSILVSDEIQLAEQNAREQKKLQQAIDRSTGFIIDQQSRLNKVVSSLSSTASGKVLLGDKSPLDKSELDEIDKLITSINDKISTLNGKALTSAEKSGLKSQISALELRKVELQNKYYGATSLTATELTDSKRILTANYDIAIAKAKELGTAADDTAYALKQQKDAIANIKTSGEIKAATDDLKACKAELQAIKQQKKVEIQVELKQKKLQQDIESFKNSIKDIYITTPDIEKYLSKNQQNSLKHIKDRLFDPGSIIDEQEYKRLKIDFEGIQKTISLAQKKSSLSNQMTTWKNQMSQSGWMTDSILEDYKELYDILQGINSEDGFNAILKAFNKIKEGFKNVDNTNISSYFETIIAKGKQVSKTLDDVAEAQTKVWRDKTKSGTLSDELAKSIDASKKAQKEYASLGASNFISTYGKQLGSEKISQYSDIDKQINEGMKKIELINKMQQALKDSYSKGLDLIKMSNGEYGDPIKDKAYDLTRNLMRERSKDYYALREQVEKQFGADVAANAVENVSKDFKTPLAKAIADADRDFIGKLNKLNGKLGENLIHQYIKDNILSIKKGIAEIDSKFLNDMLSSVDSGQKISIESFANKKQTAFTSAKQQFSELEQVYNRYNPLLKQIDKMTNFQSSGKISVWGQQISNALNEVFSVFESEKTGKITVQEAKEKLLSLQGLLDNMQKNRNSYSSVNKQGTFLENTVGKVADTKDAELALESYAEALGLTATKSAEFSNDNKKLTQEFVDQEKRLHTLTGTLENGGMRVFDKISGYSNIFGDWGQALGGMVQSFSRFFGGYHLFTRFTTEAREGLNVLKQYDAAITDMSYSMDINSAGLRNLGDSAVEMAKDLSTSLENTLGIYQIYANMNTSAQEIQETAKPTAILANLSGKDALEASDQIQGVLQQFNMLKDADADVAATSMHVVDVLDSIASNVSLDYVKGMKVITDSVTAAGAVAYDAGMSYEQLAAVSAKVAERSREDGSTIGNAIKTIVTRISKVGKMPAYADEVSNEEISKAAESLDEIGIAVYNADGSFRDLDVILTELQAKWDGLSDAQQANLSYNIAA